MIKMITYLTTTGLLLVSSILSAHPHHTHADAVSQHGFFVSISATDIAISIAIVIAVVLLKQSKYFARRDSDK